MIPSDDTWKPLNVSPFARNRATRRRIEKFESAVANAGARHVFEKRGWGNSNKPATIEARNRYLEARGYNHDGSKIVKEDTNVG